MASSSWNPTRRSRLSLQVQARALGDPTRFGIFRYIAQASAPVNIAELTEYCGLNHNAVRQHLAKLVEARLVIETTAPPSGRGRPRLEYHLDPTADARWGVANAYERLAILLAEVVRSGETPLDVGRRRGAATPITAAHAPLDSLVNELERSGFDPESRSSDEGFEIVLRACPFESAALTDPDIVCALHLGLAQGFSASIGAISVDELIPTDPRRARCRLRGRFHEH